jgi:hypothetical protein
MRGKNLPAKRANGRTAFSGSFPEIRPKPEKESPTIIGKSGNGEKEKPRLKEKIAFPASFPEIRAKPEIGKSARGAEAKKQQRVTMCKRQLGFLAADVPSLPASGQLSDVKLRFSLPADLLHESVRLSNNII